MFVVVGTHLLWNAVKGGILIVLLLFANRSSSKKKNSCCCCLMRSNVFATALDWSVTVVECVCYGCYYACLVCYCCEIQSKGIRHYIDYSVVVGGCLVIHGPLRRFVTDH